MKNKFIRHGIFWLSYATMYAYLNASFPAQSDLAYGFPMRMIRFGITELMQLPVKMLVTYGFLYWIVPQLILNQKYVRALLVALPGVFILVLISRLITYYAAYPYLYGELPTYELISAKRMLYSFLDILSATGVFAIVKLLLDRIETKKREEMLQKEKLIAELQFLKAQINPHFLFNTLNNIYGLARRKSKDTEEALLKLSGIMRFMLYECDQPTIALSQEIAAVEDYISLEKLRYGPELSINFSKQLNGQNPHVGPLLLLPFVENAFKHGASESRHERYISIAVEAKENTLMYQVENSLEQQEHKTPNGIGLKNVQQQLKLIYPNRHQLKINKSENAFQVHLEIDL